jgi:hypothetical protein
MAKSSTRKGRKRARTSGRARPRTRRSKPARKSARGKTRPAARRRRVVRARAKPAAAARKRATRPVPRRKVARPARSPQKAVSPRAPRSRTARTARAKPPALDRQRRTLEEVVPTPPSSLDLDQSASAARTGHAELQERLSEHTQTGPALTGGDVDADWEEAYSSGDEAPGGDNPTPDVNVVSDIGRSLGLEYDDHEELKGPDKIAARDAKRWELDPASSEDYKDRIKK